MGKERVQGLKGEFLSVAALRAGVASGAIDPAAAVNACRAAIRSLDDGIGAFECLADEAGLAEGGPPAGRLAGVAVGVKDIFDTADMPTTYGSEIFAGHRPRTDAAIVAMLRAAGATVIGKTVTTEYAFLNPARTRNPVNPAHTPGGSSSGSAAAVAAGMVPAAIGTQTGGSVIRPASFCGVAGYKPSFRLVPATGMKTFSWSLDTVGFFARGVRDVAELAAAATGRALAGPAAGGAIRFGLYASAVDERMDDAMRGALAAAAECLRAAGHVVSPVSEPAELAGARLAHRTIQNHEAALALAGDAALFSDRMSAVLRDALAEGRAITPERFDAARRIARQARKAAAALFSDVDVLLLPSAPGAAPKGFGSTGDPVFNALWTLLGVPAVNVPGLHDAAGMPLGLQIVAPFGRDAEALAAAAKLEDCLKAAVKGA